MRIKQIKIKPDDWSEIQENPRQRDTVAHAKKALKAHLKDYSETHARVAAAELPDGTRYKLDGHTRDYLWCREQLKAPKMLYCDLYIVDSLDQVTMLYQCFDNQFASETAGDRLASAFNLHNVSHTARMFKSGGTTTALKTLFSQRRTQLIKVDGADPVKVFKKSLNIIDKANFRHFNFPAPVMAAMIMTVHKDGDLALTFWKNYDEDLGKKTAKRFDAVYCLRDFIRTTREQKIFLGGSIQTVHNMTPRLIAIY